MAIERLLDALSEFRSVDGVSVRMWSVYAASSRRLSLGVKDREAGNAHAPLSVTEGLGVVYRIVWSDGLVSRGTLERRQVERETVEALGLARHAAYDDPDAARVAGPAPMPDVALHDRDTARTAAGDTRELAEQFELVRRSVAAGGFRTWSGSFGAAESWARVVTSSGVDAESSATLTGWHVTFDGELGAGHSSRAGEPRADFEARLDRLARFVTALREPERRVDAGVRPILLHPGVVEDYVLAGLLDNLHGAAVAHGEGAFRLEQFGSGVPVLRDDVVLRIDPLRPLAAGSYRFTSEGIPAAACTFIDRGCLVTPVLDLKYAARLGRPPTPVVAGFDAIRFEGPPTLPLDEALRAASGGALVLNVLGVHTQDMASGDFSLAAPQALAIDDGRFVGRLRATISGNLFELLRSPELRFVPFDGELTPGLLVSCRVDTR